MTIDDAKFHVKEVVNYNHLRGGLYMKSSFATCTCMCKAFQYGFLNQFQILAKGRKWNEFITRLLAKKAVRYN